MQRLACLIILISLMSCSKKSMTENPVPVPTPSGTRIVNVSTGAQLTAALANAQPNDEIVMADGLYSGKFIIPPGVNGTASKPIILRGTRNAVLNAGSTNTGYVFYMQSNYWTVKGFTVTNGLKGIMADGIHNCTIDNIRVYNIGEEGIHLRTHSSNNTIINVEITNTGIKTPDYGEGVYIGSAKSNWATYTNGNPDLSDSNSVFNCKIGPAVAAEAIDIKEGTTATVIRGNYFDATGISGANGGDSWIDVKGNYALIENNIGTNPGGGIFIDGYQVHVAVQGWGNYNQFKNNVCTVNGTGYGFNVQLSGSNGTSTGNKVYNTNTVTGAASGIANIALSN